MFIKRDHRKIPEILSSDSNEVLYLSKRTAEFNGSFSNSALYWNKNKHIKNDDNDMDINDDDNNDNNDNGSTNPLINLKRLNLYDNRLQDLEGFNALLDRYSHTTTNTTTTILLYYYYHYFFYYCYYYYFFFYYYYYYHY